MAKRRKQEVWFPPLWKMYFVVLHASTFGTKPPIPLHELCFTSDPPTFRGTLRGLAFLITAAPLMLLWVLLQVAFGIALLFFIAVGVVMLFQGI